MKNKANQKIICSFMYFVWYKWKTRLNSVDASKLSRMRHVSMCNALVQIVVSMGTGDL